jgi:hypothetical protein
LGFIFAIKNKKKANKAQGLQCYYGFAKKNLRCNKIEIGQVVALSLDLHIPDSLPPSIFTKHQQKSPPQRAGFFKKQIHILPTSADAESPPAPLPAWR